MFNAAQKEKLRAELSVYEGMPVNEDTSQMILQTVLSFCARHDIQFNSRPIVSKLEVVPGS